MMLIVHFLLRNESQIALLFNHNHTSWLPHRWNSIYKYLHHILVTANQKITAFPLKAKINTTQSRVWAAKVEHFCNVLRSTLAFDKFVFHHQVRCSFSQLYPSHSRWHGRAATCNLLDPRELGKYGQQEKLRNQCCWCSTTGMNKYGILYSDCLAVKTHIYNQQVGSKLPQLSLEWNYRRNAHFNINTDNNAPNPICRRIPRSYNFIYGLKIYVAWKINEIPNNPRTLQIISWTTANCFPITFCTDILR